MIGVFGRKSRQLIEDPALRRYLVERAVGRIKAPPSFIPGHPPYLASLELGEPPAPPALPVLDAMPAGPLTLALPGATVTLTPDEAASLFERGFDDLETMLAVHRFAWLPVQGAELGWVAALWNAWVRRFGTPTGGWEWHPYTAAERAINLLEFGRRHGLPEGAATVLVAHAPAIARQLEYGGEHYTGNHLANNGRGLYLIGLELGWERAAALGLAILLAEAGRIFAPSGMLREGSSHYHLLVTRNYLSAWLAARRAGRPEQAELAGICGRALSVLPIFALPGGLPLVGDISPDCPPSHLAGLLAGHGGWIDGLPPEDRDAIAALAQPGLGEAEGWLRADFGEWSGLWHAAAQGWPFMPGHGHHDLGGFELHWRGQRLFIDAGRGAYGETGAAAFYRSAAVHNLLQLEGADPTPANRPYYDDGFRRREGGAPPVLARGEDHVVLTHHGFRRQGAEECRRLWRFAPGRLVIEDRVGGRGCPVIARNLLAPWPVRVDGTAAVVETPAGAVRVQADCPLQARVITAWSAYGVGAPATLIVAEAVDRLPWTGRLVVEAI